MNAQSSLDVGGGNMSAEAVTQLSQRVALESARPDRPLTKAFGDSPLPTVLPEKSSRTGLTPPERFSEILPGLGKKGGGSLF